MIINHKATKDTKIFVVFIPKISNADSGFPPLFQEPAPLKKQGVFIVPKKMLRVRQGDKGSFLLIDNIFY
jgi:hypothetical protein